MEIDLIGEVIAGRKPNKVPQVVIKRNPCSMIGTWNVRTLLQTGKLENLKIGMERLKIDILGISEMRWNGQGDLIMEIIESSTLVVIMEEMEKALF